MKTKIIFIDTETTGTDTNKNGLIQIAGIVYETINTRGELKELERFDYRLKPFESDLIEPAALQVNNTTPEQLAEYPEPKVIYTLFYALLSKYINPYDRQDKAFFIGYNARFDYDFLRKFFEKNGNKYFGSFFYFPAIDVMNLAATYLMNERRELANFKLETVSKHIGIEAAGDLHDAMTDIILTKDLYLTIIKEWTNAKM